MMSVINMIESAAVVILAVLFLAFLGDRLERSFWAKSIVFGIVFGATGLISMASPVEFAPGYFADGRNIVMAFSGDCKGWARRQFASGGVCPIVGCHTLVD
ncbi:hypothetical protein NKH33_30560 [Mesorhizobium sp. M1182]|uniref:LytS/YhcK type 5TM receptor domain-containing protein n=1 Tax=Mesorhizobium sp. M1182 TaxID=2957067 RepID=UPI00333A9070